MWKISQTVLAAALLAIPAVSSAPALASDKTYELRYTEHGPSRGPRAETFMWWADELEARSNGQIKVEFFWGQSLAKAKDAIKAVRSGFADAGTVVGIYAASDLPVWNFSNTPFFFEDEWVALRTMTEAREKIPALRDEPEKLGIKVLFNLVSGPVQLMSAKKPIVSQEDLKGMKVRTAGGWTALLDALGAVPVKIGYGELYAAFDRGTIDATINYVPQVKATKQYEVASHITEANMGQIVGWGTGINLDLFESMPEELQEVVIDVSDEVVDIFAQKLIESYNQAKVDLAAGIDGNTVSFHTLSDEERENWKALAQPIIDKWLDTMEQKGIDGQAILSEITEIRAKYRKELADNGYPWER